MRPLSAAQIVNLLLAGACIVLGGGYLASGQVQDGCWSLGSTLALAALVLFNAFWRRAGVKPAEK